MFGRGDGHNRTRELVDNTPMRSSEAVVASARRVVDFIEEYPDIMQWIRFHQIDMFFSVMTGFTPDLANPKTVHELRTRLPHARDSA
jgi:hypothetical protein